MKINTKEILISELVKSKIKTLSDLAALKRKLSKNLFIPTPSNIKLLTDYHNFCQKKRVKPDKEIENLLKKRPVRSNSGVAVVSVLTKPYPCPGKCLFCPTEKGMPKSYLSNEPAVMRAVLNKFDPYKQVKTRLKSLEITGHPTDKIELIIIGGTWSFLPKKYRKWFITRCFNACNEKKSKIIPQDARQKSKLQIKSQNLLREQKRNEKAKHRIIGITVETRPDFINEKEIKYLRELGATRVELGVQTIYNKILKLNNRGHFVSETIKATRLLKDAGFKVCYHIMLNLPGSNPKKDKEMFKELFYNENFQPDLLKIYPCAILKNAPLYEKWKNKEYKHYTKSQLKNILKKIKKEIPYYCRIQRLIRDIPSYSIASGPAKISNFRQIIAREAKKESWKCKCIRCREVKENYKPDEKLYLFRQDYFASKGREIFLSYETKKRERLYSLLRLRIFSENKAIIRELHTYGQLHPIKEKQKQSPQHKGLGTKLIKEAEKIAKNEFKAKKISVISGIGVRNYYRKLGYRLKETYMVKNI